MHINLQTLLQSYARHTADEINLGCEKVDALVKRYSLRVTWDLSG